MYRGTHLVSGNLRVVKALSAVAVERDVRVAEYGIDELVHGRFLELAALAGRAGKASGTLHFLLEELVDAGQEAEVRLSVTVLVRGQPGV